MKPSPIERDERTVTVENASYRWAFIVLSFGVLVDVMYRSYALHESCWDLFALVVLSGAVGTAYQGANRVLGRRWAVSAALTVALAAVAGAVVVALLRR
jgi:hypothetical protein